MSCKKKARCVTPEPTNEAPQAFVIPNEEPTIETTIEESTTNDDAPTIGEKITEETTDLVSQQVIQNKKI
jgi:hypothetical protein